MKLIPSGTLILLAVVQIPWLLLWLRERARRLAVEKVGRDREREVFDLGTFVENMRGREARLLAQIGALWTLLEKLGQTVLELRERYKQEAIELARQTTWTEHNLWEIAELRALVTRILARWAAEKRARATESLATEILSAVAHHFGQLGRVG